MFLDVLVNSILRLDANERKLREDMLSCMPESSVSTPYFENGTDMDYYS